MSDFQDALSKILSSPEDMEKIAALASQFSGALGGDGETAPERETAHADGSVLNMLSGMDPALLGKLMRLMGAYSGRSDKAALLDAMSPYLRSEQRSKLARATEIAKIARVAKAALGEFSGGSEGAQ
ncbi:MAG: hypothetical protein LBN02_00700 [Oscillospiraceae bacterium]|jgi:hypothetical protein|nr:hypothetical protein [Oscillospiraceae bacterium]